MTDNDAGTRIVYDHDGGIIDALRHTSHDETPILAETLRDHDTREDDSP